MKKTFLLALSMLFCMGLFAQSKNYYWAEKSRMALTPSSTHFIITADAATTLTSIKPKNVQRYESWPHKPYAVVESANKTSIHQLTVDLGFDTDEVQISPGYALSDGFIIYPTRTIVVQLLNENDQDALTEMANRFGVKAITEKFGTYRIELENVNSALEAANALHESGLFKFSQPDFYAPIERYQISDPLFSQQFQMNNTGQTLDGVTGANDADCNALEAWGISLGSSSTTVAVIDDGLEDHEDFNNGSGQSRYTAGFSPANNGNGDAISGSNHGVACAGSITASHNSIGVRGVAPLANMISVNIFVGGESSQDIADGITWAKNQGADVMSNSWGYTSCTLSFTNLNNAIADANANGRGGLGCVIVFASGNGYKSCVDYPADNPNVIAVGAFANTGVRSAYSNYGPALDIMAPSNNVGGPGAGVRTTDRMGGPGYTNSNYTSTFGGTSSACPVVAGVATLVLGYNPNLSSTEVKNILYSTAIDMGASGFDNQYANGRVNAFGALQAAGGNPPTCSDNVQNGQETGIDCGGPICPPCACNGNAVTLTINLDNYPEETTWQITNSGGTVVASGGAYGAFPDGSQVVENICLAADGCYDFTINDSFGDGICCSYGSGDYALTDDSDGAVLASGGAFGSSETTNFCVSSGGGGDTQAPSNPTSLAASGTTTTTTNLSWNASSDNVGVTGYNIYIGGANIGNVPGTGANITGLSPSTTYSMYVTAFDAAGNESGASNTVTVTTLSDGGGNCIIDENDFESGLGIWNDGGSDCRRSSNDAAYANGTYCVRLRDNTSTSVMTTDNLDLAGLTSVQVDFSYYPRSMDNSNEDFWLQVSGDGGGSYQTVVTWAQGTDFVNNTRYNESVTITGTFTSTMRFRFRCDASGNSDWVYIDDVVLSSGCSSLLAGPTVSSPGQVAYFEAGESTTTATPNLLEAPATAPVEELKLYPNPTTDILNIAFELPESNEVTLVVTDLNGKVISYQTLNGDKGAQQTTMDVSQLSKGIYLVSMITSESRTTKKFVVAK